MNSKKWVILLMISLLMQSCTLRSRLNSKLNKNTDQKEVTTILVRSDMPSDEMAEAGEKLVTPQTFMLADKTFSMVLEKEPANAKALFYKAFLMRFMKFKGLLARIKPEVEKTGFLADYYNRLAKIPASPLKQFLLDGAPDITDVSKAQAFIKDYVQAANYFREFLLKNPELQFSIVLNPYFLGLSEEGAWGRTCRLTPITKGKAEDFQIQCETADLQVRKVNAGDLLVLRQWAALEVFLLAPYASYSLDGIDEIQKEPNFKSLDYEAKLKWIQSHPDLGILRDEQLMGLYTDIAQDLAGAMNWIKLHQSELCPKGPSDKRDQRLGHLFAKGFCILPPAPEQASFEDVLQMIEGTLRGSIPLKFVNGEGATVETLVDPLIVSRRPIQDLKALVPSHPLVCGEPPNLVDTTLGGIFPQADAGRFLSQWTCKKRSAQ